MVLIEMNRVRRLLHVSFVGHVQVSDFRQSRDEVNQFLAELPAGFYLLVDLSHLESMDVACKDEIVLTMEACNKKGVEAIIRVIPEPSRDIGLNILTAFHYDRRVRVFTCQSLTEGLQVLQQELSQ